MESIYGTNFGGTVCDPDMGLGSLQEMIDSDIKADFDDVLQNSQEGFQSMEGLDLLDTLDHHDFKFDDGLSGVVTNSWNQLIPTLQNPTLTSSLSNGNPMNYMDDFAQGSNIMVNPNNVMPVSTIGMTQPAHVAQLRTTNSLHGNLSINTQFSNVQHPQAPSPAQQSPHYPQLMSPMVTTTYQTPHTGSITVAGAGNVQHIHLRPQLQLPSQIVRPNVINGPSGLNKTVKVLPPGSPMQQVPSPVVHPSTPQAQQPTVIQHSHSAPNSNRKKTQKTVINEKENGFPKPGYSYSCLIALALKNSHTGHLSVSEIYKFMCEHFPYFKTAPAGWKNSVRHNLSLNKCFEKIEKPTAAGTNQRKGCLWAMNPAKITKMDDEVLKWSRKDPQAIKKGMAAPHTLEKLERGEMIKDYNANSTNTVNNATASAIANVNATCDISEGEEDPKTPTSLSSQSSSQGYDSAGSDFVDIEGFNSMPDSSLQELQIPASGSLFEDIIDERLHFTPTSVTGSTTAPTLSSNNPVVRLANNQPRATANGYYQTAIHGNYAITPAATATSTSGATGLGQTTGMKTLVVTRQEGTNRVFTVGGLN